MCTTRWWKLTGMQTTSLRFLYSQNSGNKYTHACVLLHAATHTHIHRHACTPTPTPIDTFTALTHLTCAHTCAHVSQWVHKPSIKSFKPTHCFMQVVNTAILCTPISRFVITDLTPAGPNEVFVGRWWLPRIDWECVDLNAKITSRKMPRWHLAVSTYKLDMTDHIEYWTMVGKWIEWAKMCLKLSITVQTAVGNLSRWWLVIAEPTLMP